MSDIIFHRDNYIFGCRAAGILINGGKVLLQCPKNTNEYAFPGGHVALGETAAETLYREWREEIGAEIEVGELKWVEENLFKWGSKDAHQISLTFLVTLKDGEQIPLEGSFISKEYKANDDSKSDSDSAVWFHWVKLSDIKNLTVYPTKAAELLPLLNEGVKHFIYRG